MKDFSLKINGKICTDFIDFLEIRQYCAEQAKRTTYAIVYIQLDLPATLIPKRRHLPKYHQSEKKMSTLPDSGKPMLNVYSPSLTRCVTESDKVTPFLASECKNGFDP